MPDESKRSSDDTESHGVADFVRSAAPPVAGALTAAGIGAVVAGPVGASVGGVVGALIPEIAEALEERRKRANEAVNEVVSWAAELSDMSIADLAAWSVGDDDRLQLLAATVQAALSSLDRIKLRTLARVLAEAVDDDAKLDPAVLITRCLADLEPLHLRVLSAMADEIPPKGDPMEGEMVGAGVWRYSALAERFEHYGSGIGVVVATLEQHALLLGGGLAAMRSDGQTADLVWSVADFGKLVLAYLAGSGAELDSEGSAPTSARTGGAEYSTEPSSGSEGFADLVP